MKLNRLFRAGSGPPTEGMMTEIRVGDTVTYTEAELMIRYRHQQRPVPRPTGVVTDVIISHPRTARVRWAGGGVTEVVCTALQAITTVAEAGRDQRVAELRGTNYEATDAEVRDVCVPGDTPEECAEHYRAIAVGGTPRVLQLQELPPQGLTPRDWQDAIDVQNAVNLSGMVHSLAAVMPRVIEDVRWRGAGQGGTERWNRHPLVYLWVNKLADLSGQNSMDTERYGVAYALAQLEAELPLALEAKGEILARHEQRRLELWNRWW